MRPVGAALLCAAALAAGCGGGRGGGGASSRTAVAPRTANALLARSGAIARPGEVDRFRFAVAPGTRVSLEARPVRGLCGRNRTFLWSLWSLAAAGSPRPVLEEKPLYIAGFCYSPGPLVLERGGSYVLRVHALGRTTGPYAFAVWNAPVQDFGIRVGSFVAPGRPMPGAGRLEVPGSIDRYTFTARAETRIVVDARPVGEWCGRGQVLRWSLFSDRLPAPVLADQLLYSHGSCYHSDPVKLPVGGRYALLVYGPGPQWDHGSYRFVLVPIAR